jgi:hypothetical protein
MPQSTLHRRHESVPGTRKQVSHEINENIQKNIFQALALDLMATGTLISHLSKPLTDCK